MLHLSWPVYVQNGRVNGQDRPGGQRDYSEPSDDPFITTTVSESKLVSSDPQAEAITYIVSHGGLSEIEFFGVFEPFLSDADFAKARLQTLLETQTQARTDYVRANVLRNRLAKMGVN